MKTSQYHPIKTVDPVKTDPIFKIAIITTIIGFVVMIVFLVMLSYNYNIFSNNSIELDKTSQVGDFIGGLVGSLWTFSGILLFYLAIKLQGKELREQRKQLELQNEELKISKNQNAVSKITDIIYKQIELLNEYERNLEFAIPLDVKNPNNKLVLKGRNIFNECHKLLHYQLNLNEIEFEKTYKLYFDENPFYFKYPGNTTFYTFMDMYFESLKMIKGLINKEINYHNINSEDEKLFMDLIASNFGTSFKKHFLLQELLISQSLNNLKKDKIIEKRIDLIRKNLELLEYFY